MKKLTKRYGVYLPLFVLVALSSVVLKCVAAMTSLSYEYGSYGGSAVYAASRWIIYLSVLLLLTYAFYGEKKKLVPSFSTPATYIPTGAGAVALFFVGATMLVKCGADLGRVGSYGAGKSLIAALLGATTTAGVSYFLIVLVELFGGLLAIASIGYLLLSGADDRRLSPLRGEFGMLLSLFCCTYAAFLYFSETLPINAPNKIDDQMAYLACALFFLYETRVSLGREKWQAYSAFALVASLLTLYSSVPALLVYFVRGELISYSIMETVLTFALAIFALSRVVITAYLPEATENLSVAAMREAAGLRQTELDEAYAAEEAAYAEAEALAAQSADDTGDGISDVGDENQIAIDIPAFEISTFPDDVGTQGADAESENKSADSSAGKENGAEGTADENRQSADKPVNIKEKSQENTEKPEFSAENQATDAAKGGKVRKAARKAKKNPAAAAKPGEAAASDESTAAPTDSEAATDEPARRVEYRCIISKKKKAQPVPEDTDEGESLEESAADDI